MKTCLKKYGKNLKGHTYTKQTLQHAVTNLNKELLGTIKAAESPIQLTQVAFTVHNLTLEDDGLYGEINLLNTPQGNVLKAMLPNIRFSLVGTGIVEDDGNITDYSITSVCTIIT